MRREACPARKRQVTASCAADYVADDEASGQCCWAGQVWSEAKGACVGRPRCSGGKVESGETCLALPICEGGLVATAESQARCCWPGQSWSNGACAGTPTACKADWVPSGDTCVPGPRLAIPRLQRALPLASMVEEPHGGWSQCSTQVVELVRAQQCKVLLRETTDACGYGGMLSLRTETYWIDLSAVTSLTFGDAKDSSAPAGADFRSNPDFYRDRRYHLAADVPPPRSHATRRRSRRKATRNT